MKAKSKRLALIAVVLVALMLAVVLIGCSSAKASNKAYVEIGSSYHEYRIVNTGEGMNVINTKGKKIFGNDYDEITPIGKNEVMYPYYFGKNEKDPGGVILSYNGNTLLDLTNETLTAQMLGVINMGKLTNAIVNGEGRINIEESPILTIIKDNNLSLYTLSKTGASNIKNYICDNEGEEPVVLFNITRFESETDSFYKTSEMQIKTIAVEYSVKDGEDYIRNVDAYGVGGALIKSYNNALVVPEEGAQYVADEHSMYQMGEFVVHYESGDEMKTDIFLNGSVVEDVVSFDLNNYVIEVDLMGVFVAKENNADGGYNLQLVTGTNVNQKTIKSANLEMEQIICKSKYEERYDLVLKIDVNTNDGTYAFEYYSVDGTLMFTLKNPTDLNNTAFVLEGGETNDMLYSIATGQSVCQFSGHVEIVAGDNSDGKFILKEGENKYHVINAEKIVMTFERDDATEFGYEEYPNYVDAFSFKSDGNYYCIDLVTGKIKDGNVSDYSNISQADLNESVSDSDYYYRTSNGNSASEEMAGSANMIELLEGNNLELSTRFCSDLELCIVRIYDSTLRKYAGGFLKVKYHVNDGTVETPLMHTRYKVFSMSNPANIYSNKFELIYDSNLDCDITYTSGYLSMGKVVISSKGEVIENVTKESKLLILTPTSSEYGNIVYSQANLENLNRQGDISALSNNTYLQSKNGYYGILNVSGKLISEYMYTGVKAYGNFALATIASGGSVILQIKSGSVKVIEEASLSGKIQILSVTDKKIVYMTTSYINGKMSYCVKENGSVKVKNLLGIESVGYYVNNDKAYFVYSMAKTNGKEYLLTCENDVSVLPPSFNG